MFFHHLLQNLLVLRKQFLVLCDLKIHVLLQFGQFAFINLCWNDGVGIIPYFYLFFNCSIALQRYKYNVTNNVTLSIFYETLIKPIKIAMLL